MAHDPGRSAAAAEPDPFAGLPELLEPAGGVPPLLTTPAEIASATAALANGSGPLAADTERAHGFTYFPRAYLLQFKRTGSGTFLIDPTGHPDALAGLAEALNPLEWILHSAPDDLPCLRELGFEPATLFDTALAARLLSVERVNLGAVVAEFVGVRLRKGHSADNWSTRPLPQSWLNYAALDVEVLVQLREKLIEELVADARLEWHDAEAAAILTAPPSPGRAEPWRRLKGLSTLTTPRQRAIARAVWLARDERARDIDVAPTRVLPDADIVAVAANPPRSARELTTRPTFGGPRQSQLADYWFGAIETGLQLTDTEVRASMRRTRVPGEIPQPNSWRRINPAADERLVAARAAATGQAYDLGLPPEVMIDAAAIRALCWAQPPTSWTATEVTDRLLALRVRPWQAEQLAEPLAAALAAAAAGAVSDPDSGPAAQLPAD